MAEHKVFHEFFDQKPDSSRKSGAPMPLDEIVELLGRLGHMESFLGITDSAGKTLQVAYHGKDHYWVEIPDPPSCGSYGKHCSYEELCTIFQNVGERIDREDYADFEFQGWGR